MDKKQYDSRKKNRAEKRQANEEKRKNDMNNKIDGINNFKKEIKGKCEALKNIDFNEKLEELKKEGHSEESDEIKKYKKIQENLPKIKNILELQKILDKEVKKIEEEIINRGIPERKELQQKNSKLEKIEKELKELENNPEKNAEKIKDYNQDIEEKKEEISNLEKNIEEHQEKRKEKKSDYGELSDNALLNRYSKVKSQSAKCDLILETLLAGKEWKDINFNKNVYVNYKESKNAQNKLFDIIKQERKSREAGNKKQEEEKRTREAGSKTQEQNKLKEKNTEEKQTNGVQTSTIAPANQILQQEKRNDKPKNTENQENEVENTSQNEKSLVERKPSFFRRLLNNIKSRFKFKNEKNPQNSEPSETQIIDTIINSKFSTTAEFIANNGMEKFKEKYKIEVEKTGKQTEKQTEKPKPKHERTESGREI